MKPKTIVTNDQASEYDFSIDIPFPVGTISKPQKKMSQSMDMLWSAGN
jgi:hypothetical protein